MHRPWILLVGLLALAACQPRVDDAALKSLIDGRNQALGAVIAQGNAAGAAGFYTDDAQLMPPNMPTVSGRAGIEAAWTQFLAMGVKDLQLTAREVHGYADTATEVGDYRLIGPGAQVIDDGKYLVLWRRVEGAWFLHRDIWNSNRPLPPPPAPVATEPAADPAMIEAPAPETVPASPDAH